MVLLAGHAFVKVPEPVLALLAFSARPVTVRNHHVTFTLRGKGYTFAQGGLSNQWTGAVPRCCADDFTVGEKEHEKYRWPVSLQLLSTSSTPPAWCPKSGTPVVDIEILVEGVTTCPECERVVQVVDGRIRGHRLPGTAA